MVAVVKYLNVRKLVDLPKGVAELEVLASASAPENLDSVSNCGMRSKLCLPRTLIFTGAMKTFVPRRNIEMNAPSPHLVCLDLSTASSQFIHLLLDYEYKAHDRRVGGAGILIRCLQPRCQLLFRRT